MNRYPGREDFWDRLCPRVIQCNRLSPTLPSSRRHLPWEYRWIYLFALPLGEGVKYLFDGHSGVGFNFFKDAHLPGVVGEHVAVFRQPDWLTFKTGAGAGVITDKAAGSSNKFFRGRSDGNRLQMSGVSAFRGFLQWTKSDAVVGLHGRISGAETCVKVEKPVINPGAIKNSVPDDRHHV